MIQLNYINVNGSIILQRDLTEEEKQTVTSVTYNGTCAFFYQGDEPQEDIQEVTQEKPIPVVDVVGLLRSLKPEELQEIKNILNGL